MNPLVIAEHEKGRLDPATLSALEAASCISEQVSLLAMGDDCGAVAEHASSMPQIAEVLVAESESLSCGSPESCANLIATVGQGHGHVLMATGSAAHNWLPRAAALCGCPMVTDVVAIKDAETYVRPTYAGKVLETVRCSAPHKFLSVRATAFPAQEKVSDSKQATVKDVLESFKEPSARSRFVSLIRSETNMPELETAQIVVSAGRGVVDTNGFELVVRFAKSIGAALGTSRAAVDAGYAPSHLQVGQSGKEVAPELYIAVGISGAVHHVAGMLDSGMIVAINKDKDAPIFDVADYGLVGDFQDVLPKLEKALLA